MSVSDFARSVVQEAMERALLLPEDRVLVALSGGVDSSALLVALGEAATGGLLPPPVGVAHFHHGMRGRDADADAGFCAGLASRQGLPCVIGLGALAGANEAQARAQRYAFLEEAARDLGADVVVTAHHADDQAETVLQRVLRGTSVAGLRGIPGRRPLAPGLFVARPLLTRRRRELEDYCQGRGISPRHDPTNDEARFLRHRLRALLPQLEQEINPQVVAALLRLAEHAAEDAAVLEPLAETLWRETCQAEVPLTLRMDALRRAPTALRHRVLLRALWSLPVELHEALATSRWVQRLDALLVAPGALDLPDGWRAGSDRETLVLTRGTPVLPQPFAYPLTIPGIVRLPSGEHLRAFVGPPQAVRARERRGRRVDCGTIPASLVVRNLEPGDRIAPLGMAGKTRLVRDLLREAGVPVAQRATWPVVMDGDSAAVLWVVGIAQAEATRVPDTESHALILALENID